MSALEYYSHPVQKGVSGSNANVPNGTNGSNASGASGTVGAAQRTKVATGMSGGRLWEKQQVLTLDPKLLFFMITLQPRVE